ncbi:aspartate racemase [Oleiphilus sp. HI0130]|uniref:aspartate/glutamate racemase family protein n=1 Tax=Oleiphilus sp. HI0079 TaxID=1822254 RepID=UPI0007C40CA0|nr:aspartate/glutamate racemase family protein [Oleiphilus sp. HI0079]KZZ12180.1 aspartate racemase [Oleiphilus sp. HI0079]KZZ14244.1 aspartate racemase [Oleiphilus sp. HI0079]KZZ71100.1 aspartate racemase [Oleiphilus sp. HI0130]
MKTIGLLGGMSWESTQGYYKAINEGVKNHLGGLHSAKIAMVSVDFAEIEALQMQDNWQQAGEILASAAVSVEAAGADGLLICTNTMHKVADAVQSAINIPLLHIADATGEALVHANVKTVGLLGTAFTMEQDFYKGRLTQHFGLKVITPTTSDRADVHRIIYEELCLGNIQTRSRKTYLEVIERMAAQGAEAVILGCTEIGLLVEQADTDTPLFDTTAIHARKAVEFMLAAECEQDS